MLGDEEKEIRGRCAGCESMRVIYGTGGWSFPACYQEPYKGKWTAEIEHCPIGIENSYEE